MYKATRAARPRLPEIRNAVLAMPPMRNGRPPVQGKKFWNFRNTVEGEGELMLYGDISDSSWWGDEVTPKQFAADLQAIGDVKAITVRINSGGGDIFAGRSIATLLKDHKATIVAKIDGICASAATFVAGAADKILIDVGAYMMYHKPLAGLMGYYYDDELDSISQYLGVMKAGMIDAYAARTGKDKKEMAKILDAVTWYTAEEAVAEGFADEVIGKNSSSQNVVINGNKLVINGVDFDMDMLPQRVVASFSAKAGQKPGSDTPPPTKNENKEEHHMTLEELRAQHPDLVNQVEQAATATATANERKRIQSIDELANTVDAALITEAKYTTPATAEVVAMRAVKEGKFLNTAYVAGTKADANDGANKVAGAAADQANGKNEKTAKDKAEIDHAGDIAKKAMAGYNPRR